MNQSQTSDADASTPFVKVCGDCGRTFETDHLQRRFCPSCVKHRAVKATARYRERSRRDVYRMKRIITNGADAFADIHLMVRRAVFMMNAGRVVFDNVQDWLASVCVPDELKNDKWDGMISVLNSYAKESNGGVK